MNFDGYAEVEDVKALAETDGGALRCIKDDETFFVPLSVIHVESDVREPGDYGTLIIPEFMAVEKGLV